MSAGQRDCNLKLPIGGGGEQRPAQPTYIPPFDLKIVHGAQTRKLVEYALTSMRTQLDRCILIKLLYDMMS